MDKANGYRILKSGLRLVLGVALCTGVALAQRAPVGLTQIHLYCSGLVTSETPAKDLYVISGEDSSYKSTFSQGDYVFINRGADQGVKPGDEFEVIRPEKDPNVGKWFKYQRQLSEAMGTRYSDVGRLRVLRTDPKTSTAELTLSCDLMQRGDIIRPFQARPVPALHNIKFDPFAPPSGKKTAMVVNTKDFGMLSAAGGVIYVNLGSSQGVQVGDYFRVFRYQGTHFDTMYEIKDTSYKVYGFGSTPVAYNWDNLPRQVLGEGIVLRTGPNTSTVVLTYARQDIFVGDYVELE